MSGWLTYHTRRTGLRLLAWLLRGDLALARYEWRRGHSVEARQRVDDLDERVGSLENRVRLLDFEQQAGRWGR